jgi:aminoglycoside 6-adenylyltransferase
VIGLERPLDHRSEIEKVVTWARSDDNIRAVVLTGSAARGLEHVDEMSDLDIELYVESPAALLDDDSWHTQFGEVLVVEALANPGWHPTRLLYCVGKKFDLMIAPVAAIEDAAHADAVQVLLDKDGIADHLTASAPPVADPPEPTAFLEVVHWFYAAAIMCAKAVARDEPWVAKVRAWDMNRHLLRMIEWDHKARYGWSYATGHAGQGVARWMDGDVLGALDACWTGFPVAETAGGLRATVDLFEEVSTRTAASLGLPVFDNGPVRREIRAILARVA